MSMSWFASSFQSWYICFFRCVADKVGSRTKVLIVHRCWRNLQPLMEYVQVSVLLLEGLEWPMIKINRSNNNLCSRWDIPTTTQEVPYLEDKYNTRLHLIGSAVRNIYKIVSGNLHVEKLVLKFWLVTFFASRHHLSIEMWFADWDCQSYCTHYTIHVHILSVG